MNKPKCSCPKDQKTLAVVGRDLRCPLHYPIPAKYSPYDLVTMRKLAPSSRNKSS